MKERILGFDIARSYAIFGMFVVNFNIVFGSREDGSTLNKILHLFNGNSSSLFVILAGMGVALMPNRAEYSADEKANLRTIIIKRSWFLFVFGLIFYNWWTADILHFYGGYLHLAALLLFVPKKFYLWAAAAAIFVFHALLLVIPYETGWNFQTLQYTDFWTLAGFLRNTFYNGWNPIFPWVAFFFFGMWLGRLDWQNAQIKQRILLGGIIVFVLTEILQTVATNSVMDVDLRLYLTADYVPPFLPFLLGTAGFSMIILVLTIYLGEKFGEISFLKTLAKTGQMTLTHYVFHLTAGMILLAILCGKISVPTTELADSLSPLSIALFSILFFSLSVIGSHFWLKKFKHGPLESLMRILSRPNRKSEFKN